MAYLKVFNVSLHSRELGVKADCLVLSDEVLLLVSR